jgi:predicted nuclease of predicted toxin-antitoxin system
MRPRRRITRWWRNVGLRVKLDEDLSPLVGEPLVSAGHTVLTVVGQGWSGLKDDELWRRVSDEQAFFVTADRGFGDLRLFPPGGHAGIMLLRPERDSIVDLRELVAAVLANRNLESLAGAITVATPRRIRVRRAPL